MRSLLLVQALIVLASIVVACGGSAGSEQTEAGLGNRAEPQANAQSSSSGSDQTQAGLRNRAESQAKAQSDGNWVEWYGFLSAGSKVGCTVEEFSAAAGSGMAQFRESKGLEESDKLEFRIKEVTMNGARGVVIADMYFDGELIFDSPNEPWVYAGGDWRSVITIPECASPSPTPEPAGKTDGSFGESDMRALLFDEEVTAAIPLVIGDTPPITDMAGLSGDGSMVGIDSIWAHLFPSADARGRLMVIVTDFESPETLQQQVAVWTVRDSMKFTDTTIGGGSLQGQQGDSLSLRFWKGDRTVLLRTTGLPMTQEVLDGLISLAELSASRLGPR